jgi:hypothetical protein
MLRAGRGGNGDLEVISRCMLGGVGIEGLATRLEQENEVLRLGGIGWVFPVDIETIETPICDRRSGLEQRD